MGEPSSDLKIVKFDRGRHGAFVCTTFRRSVRSGWPWGLVPEEHIVDGFRRALADPDAITLVAEVAGEEGAFAGWICTLPAPSERSNREVVFAYTRHALRREFKVCTTLCMHAGVDPTSAPTPIRFWTRASERIALAKGWPLYAHVAGIGERKSA